MFPSCPMRLGVPMSRGADGRSRQFCDDRLARVGSIIITPSPVWMILLTTTGFEAAPVM